MARTPKLVVFDMAGTTVNDPNGVTRSFQDAMVAAGLNPERERINAVMGLPKREAIHRILSEIHPGSDLDSRVDSIHADFVQRMIRFYTVDVSVVETPGAIESFQELRRRGIRVAINTGFSRNIAQVIMDRLGWARKGLIDDSITSDEVARGRPYPDMIRRLMATAGVDDPGFVAKVGDTPVDLQEGANAGCGWNIGVTNGTHSHHELAPFPHTHLISSLRELLGAFGERA